MSRRLFYFLIALVCALGALLLLSALVESTAAVDQETAELPAAHTITAFVSMPPTPTTASALSPAAWLRIAALFAAAVLLIPCQTCTCDANGRVICKRRYVRSYYLVFRPEFACG
jgi:hypothetical protein